MHADEQTADSQFAVIILIYIVARECFYMVDNQIPASKIEISNTTINAFDSNITDNPLQTISELDFDVVVYPCHSIKGALLLVGAVTDFYNCDVYLCLHSPI